METLFQMQNNFKTNGLLFLISLLFLSPFVFAATVVPFTINMSEIVTVTGIPRIVVNVGGTTRYANYVSGSGTATLVFSYQMISGDIDADGVVLSSPIDLNGGTIKDASGNNATLTFTIPNTSAVIINGAIPNGYSVAFSNDTVTNTNKTGLSFVITSPQTNGTYNYSISSSGGGAPVTGTGSLTSSPQTISGINVTGLPDGLLTLSVTLTDSLGGVGVAVTDTIPMAVLNANLIGHWTFDSNDMSGTIAYDRSGGAINGILQGTPTSVSGIMGTGLKFDGVSSGDRVSLGASVTLNPTIFTLSTWISPITASNPYGYIYSNSRDCCGTYKGIEFRLGTNKMVGSVWNSTAYSKTSIGSIANNSGWHHVAFSYDGATAKLYIDGTLDSQGASVLGVGSPSTYSSYIGAMGHGPGTYILDGTLDDFRIYNTALSSGQISTLYTVH